MARGETSELRGVWRQASAEGKQQTRRRMRSDRVQLRSWGKQGSIDLISETQQDLRSTKSVEMVDSTTAERREEEVIWQGKERPWLASPDHVDARVLYNHLTWIYVTWYSVLTQEQHIHHHHGRGMWSRDYGACLSMTMTENTKLVREAFEDATQFLNPVLNRGM